MNVKAIMDRVNAVEKKTQELKRLTEMAEEILLGRQEETEKCKDLFLALDNKKQELDEEVGKLTKELRKFLKTGR